MDNGSALSRMRALPSGKVPVGLLLNDMVNIDLTRQHLNQHKDEVQKGGKVTLLKRVLLLPITV
jgi:Arc/MetJ family transcription regulator